MKYIPTSSGQYCILIAKHHCFSYKNDILLFSTSLEAHILRLKQAFDSLRESNCEMPLYKTEYNHSKEKYLGHVISTGHTTQSR